MSCSCSRQPSSDVAASSRARRDGGGDEQTRSTTTRLLDAGQRVMKVMACLLVFHQSLTGFQSLPLFLPEVREFIKTQGLKTNTHDTRGGRKAHRPLLLRLGLYTPPSSRTASSGRFVWGRPQTPARLGVANPPGPISGSDPTRGTDGYPCCPSP